MVTQLHHYFLVTGLRRWWFLSLMDNLLYSLYISVTLRIFVLGSSQCIFGASVTTGLLPWFRARFGLGCARHLRPAVLGWSYFGLWATVLHIHRYFSTLAYSVGGAPSSSLMCLVRLILPNRWLLFADALVFH